PDIISSLIGILFGCYILGIASKFPEDVIMGIGPAFFPSILATLLIFFSFLLLCFALMGKSKGTVEKFNFKDPGTQRAGIALLATIIYSLLLNVGGFIVTTILYLFGLMFLLKKREYLKMALISAGVTLGVFIIFEKFLHISLPLGFLNITF
ncbi:MAG: tripartite tricarboxylate transporter TctB family protein, partial [Bacteroidota bacterium]